MISETSKDDVESGVKNRDNDILASVNASPNIFPSEHFKSTISPKNDVNFDHTEDRIAEGEAVLTQQKTLDDNRPQRRTLWYALACMSLLIIGAMIVVGVRMAGNNTSTLTPRQQQLSDTVNSISDSTALANPASPQAQARHWLLFDDDLWVDQTQEITRDMVVQRYVLAVFYFATGGPTYWIGNNWLHGRECNQNNSWTGISCNTNGQVREVALGKRSHCMASMFCVTRRFKHYDTTYNLLLCICCIHRHPRTRWIYPS